MWIATISKEMQERLNLAKWLINLVEINNVQTSIDK